MFVFSLWQLTIQFPKVYHRITVDSVSVQRRIIANQSYGIFTYVSPHTWVVVSETIVIQPCFTILILPLIAKRTITSKNAYCKITFFARKSHFSVAKPQNHPPFGRCCNVFIINVGTLPITLAILSR